ncbi:hypothetical protein VNO77_11289 [Canavalia gladiata]|uniref:Uncharacterized protein n=1 Tax=Canavalia gladiata TaxID=3824 RepID=A0AAN9QXM1_CANGL
MSSNSKAAKRQSVVWNDKRVEVGSSERRGTIEEDEEEEEKKEAVCVTSQLCLKPIKNSQNLDKEVVLRRIRHRKRMNKVRSAVGAFLRSPFSSNTSDSSVQGKRWVDDAFAAL